MPTIESYPQGAPCYVELITPDQSAAKAFYGGLFGWDMNDTDMGDAGFYTSAKLQDRTVAGISGQMPQLAGHPAFWGVYIAVDDVDKIAAAVSGLGGKVEADPFDVMDLGRMASIQDPTGARVNLWQAAASRGCEVRGDDNTALWHELVTPDVEAGTKFYADLLGVTWTDASMPGFDYTVLETADGEQRGGAFKPGDDMPPMPPHWNTYFAVADVDAAVAKASELGGKTFAPAFDVPTVGRMAMVADPQGGMFWLMTPDPRVESQA